MPHFLPQESPQHHQQAVVYLPQAQLTFSGSPRSAYQQMGQGSRGQGLGIRTRCCREGRFESHLIAPFSPLPISYPSRQALHPSWPVCPFTSQGVPESDSAHS
ncbi:hypothetical protein ACOSQ2_009913 [Xanthoceras sorbifolium]